MCICCACITQVERAIADLVKGCACIRGVDSWTDADDDDETADVAPTPQPSPYMTVNIMEPNVVRPVRADGARRLRTHVRPKDASHSCAGIAFEVHALTEPILIRSVLIAGDLGDVIIVASRHTGHEQWRQGLTDCDWRKWMLVGSASLKRRWRKPASVELDVPVPLAAGERRCLYVHSTAGACGLLCDTVSLGQSGALLREDRRGKVALYAGGAAFAHDPKASVFSAGGVPLRGGYGIVGGIRFDEMQGEGLVRFMDASDRFRDKLSVLNEQQPFIGHVNRQVIDEWNGLCVNPPGQVIRLPFAGGPPQLLSGDGHEQLDKLWHHVGCREVWLRYLGSNAWLAHARGVVGAIRLCQTPLAQEHACLLLERLLWAAQSRKRTEMGVYFMSPDEEARTLAIEAQRQHERWRQEDQPSSSTHADADEEGASRPALPPPQSHVGDQVRGLAVATAVCVACFTASIMVLAGFGLLLQAAEAMVLNQTPERRLDEAVQKSTELGWPRELQVHSRIPEPPPFPPASPFPPPFPPPVPPSPPSPPTLPPAPPLMPSPPVPPREMPPFAPTVLPFPPSPASSAVLPPGVAPPMPPPLPPPLSDASSLIGSLLLLVGALLLMGTGSWWSAGHRYGWRSTESAKGVASQCLEALVSECSTSREVRVQLQKVLRLLRTGASLIDESGFEARACLAKAAEYIDRLLLENLDLFRDEPPGARCERLSRMGPRPVTLGDFSLLRRIGKGAYGEVHVARKEDTLSLVALKVIKLQRVRSHRAIEHLRIERESLERVTNERVPFVCTLNYAFTSGSWLVLAVPFFSGGVLEVHIEERGAPPDHCGLPTSEVAFLASQMVLALEGLHGLRLLHRDVKPNNLVLRRDGYYVLADLGLVAPLEAGKPPPSSRTGSRGYWAPEVVRREAQSEAADWWSLGVTLLYAAMGTHPFRVRHPSVEYPPKPPNSSAEPSDTVGATNRRCSAAAPAAPAEVEMTNLAPTAVPSPAPSPAPRVDGSRVKLTDDELNANTLSMPLEPVEWGIDAQLASLIVGLLKRDQGVRLGSEGGAEAVRRHPLFEGVEWALLREGKLPAPFLPNPTLVYAKDTVPPLSEDAPAPRVAARATLPIAEPGADNGEVGVAQLGVNRQTSMVVDQEPPAAAAQAEAQSEEFLQRWDYVSGPLAYAKELGELVRKSPPGDDLWSR